MYKTIKSERTKEEVGSPQWGSSSVEDLWPTTFNNNTTQQHTQQQQQHTTQQPIRRSQRTRTRPSRLYVPFEDSDLEDADQDSYEFDDDLDTDGGASSSCSSLASSAEADDLVDPSFEEEDEEEEQEGSSSSPQTSAEQETSTLTGANNNTQKSHGNPGSNKRKRAADDTKSAASHVVAASTPSKPSGGRRHTKRTYGRACARCRRDHKACDGGRPCSRCAEQGSVDECVDVPIKPLGRPRKVRVLNEHGEEVIAPSVTAAKKQAKKPQRKSVLPKRRASHPKKQIKITPVEEEEAAEPSSQNDDELIIEDLTTESLEVSKSSVLDIAEDEEESEQAAEPSVHIKEEPTFSSPVPMSRPCNFRRERCKLLPSPQLPHTIKTEPSVAPTSTLFYQQPCTSPMVPRIPTYAQPQLTSLRPCVQSTPTYRLPSLLPQQQPQQSFPTNTLTSEQALERQAKAEMLVKACTNPIMMLAPLRPHDSQPAILHVSESMAALLHYTTDEMRAPGTCIIAPGFMHRFDKIAESITRKSMNPYSQLVRLDLVFNTKIGYYLTSQAKAQVYYSNGECSKIAIFVEEWNIVTPQSLYSIYPSSKCQADDRAFHDRLANLFWMGRAASVAPTYQSMPLSAPTSFAPIYPPTYGTLMSTTSHMAPSHVNVTYAPSDENPPSDPVTSPTSVRSPPFSSMAMTSAYNVTSLASSSPFAQMTSALQPSSTPLSYMTSTSSAPSFLSEVPHMDDLISEYNFDSVPVTTAASSSSAYSTPACHTSSVLRLSSGPSSITETLHSQSASSTSFSPLSNSFNGLLSSHNNNNITHSSGTDASTTSWMYPMSPADSFGYNSFTGILAD